MAGRIPQQFIDDLLDRVDIVDVIDRRVKLKKTGKNYSARCPFHDEKTPSFSVNPEKQFYYCFGCGAGGNALGFLMDYENVDFPQAVDNLAGTVGLEVPREQSPGRGPEPVSAQRNPMYELMERCAAFYRDALRHHPQRERAVAYLKGRGLSGEIARDFGLGLAPPGWDNLLRHLLDERPDAGAPGNAGAAGAAGAAGKVDTEAVQKLAVEGGVLVRNEAGRVYDRFRDRIVFPIRDRRGRVIAFGGRVLGDEKPKYLNSPETPIFHKGRELYGLYEARRANRGLERIIVVEGYMDVIALAQAGISNAVATLGTSTSTEHLERIFRVAPEVVFCFDGDEAGRKAAERGLRAALPVMSDGRQARFLFLREGEDPDSMVRSEGASAFHDLIATAQPLEEFLFQSQAAGLDLATMEGRASLSKRALPLLREFPSGVFQQLMMQSLADRTGLELESLMRLEVPKAPPAPAAPTRGGSAEDAPPPGEYAWGADPGPPDAGYPPDYPPAEDPALAHDDAPSARHGGLAQAAIALLLHQPAIATLADPQSLASLQGREGQLLREILELLHKRPESSTGMLLGHWYGTAEGELLAELAGQERLIPLSGIETQFRDIMRRLSSLPLRERIVAEIDDLKHRPYAQLSSDDRARLPELIRALRDLDTRTEAGRE